MGKFEGILLCSDWDGTLFDGTEVAADSIEAISYFMSEGGKFSICTGRGPEFLVEMQKFLRGNTYSVCYGGALVADAFSGEILREGFVDPDAFDVLDGILNCGAKVKRINIMRRGGTLEHYTLEEYESVKKDLDKKAYKITVNGESDSDGEFFKQYAECNPDKKYTIARSFASYVEIMKTDLTKGSSALLLKKHLGARLLIGMGDYENDAPLFAETDVSYAVGNAVESLKAIATKTVPQGVDTGAARAIIEDIERCYLK